MSCIFCEVAAKTAPASLVHGYGVAHAHLIIVPQHGPHHLTSDRFAHISDGKIVFDLSEIPLAQRSLLDQHAQSLASD